MHVNIDQLKKMNREELKKQVEASLTMRKAIAVRLGQPFDEVKQPGDTVLEQYLNEGRDHWKEYVDGTTDELLSILKDYQGGTPQSTPTNSLEAFSREPQTPIFPHLKRVQEILAVEPQSLQPKEPTKPTTSLEAFSQMFQK